jgi:hypothetical protein
LRERIERRCVMEEIAFVQHFPGSEGLVQGARERLQTAWWTGEYGSQHRARLIEALNPPRWLRWIAGADRRPPGRKS